MSTVRKWMIVILLVPPSSFCYSQDVINLVLLPDPFSCHQAGIETVVSDVHRLGLLGVKNCQSDRPTFGNPHKDVDNTFSRLLLPWTYAGKGVWADSFFIKFLPGMESHKFTSRNGSRVEVTFTDIVIQAGYQWFWDNGFNLSLSGGAGYLIRRNLKKDVSSDEDSDVVRFLDKNSKTNIHPGGGVILGWAF